MVKYLNNTLTFTHASSAILTGNIFALAITPTVIGFRIIAVATAKLLAIGTTWTPRRPWRPFPIHFGTDWTASLFLYRRAFASRPVINWGRVITCAGTGSNPATAFGRTVAPSGPVTPLARYCNDKNIFFDKDKVTKTWESSSWNSCDELAPVLSG